MKKNAPSRKTLVVSDNFKIIEFIQQFLQENGLFAAVDVVCSPKAPANVLRLPGVRAANIRTEASTLADDYGLVISAHCKQIFPEELYSTVECVNIHPGFNPETRGWYPQVWGIIFGHEVGVTVHRIDGELDHGDIIDRVPVEAFIWDTSKSLYDRILEAEIQWIRTNLQDLLSGSYSARKMESEGNLFLKKDFESLCEFDLSERGSFLTFYNRLRALSFNGYQNAYFVDPNTKKKIYLELKITPDEL